MKVILKHHGSCPSGGIDEGHHCGLIVTEDEEEQFRADIADDGGPGESYMRCDRCKVGRLVDYLLPA
jgi:hypothetical protein